MTATLHPPALPPPRNLRYKFSKVRALVYLLNKATIEL
jgi:hypothetical protein